MSESYIARQRRERSEFEARKKASGRTRSEQVAVDNSNSPQAVQERRAAATSQRAEELREKGASQAAIEATGVNDRVTITQPARDAQGRTATDVMIQQNAQDRQARALALAEFTTQQTMELRRQTLLANEILAAKQEQKEQAAAMRRAQLAEAQRQLDNVRRGPIDRIVLASPLARKPTAQELLDGGALGPGGFVELRPSSDVVKQTVFAGALSDVTAPIARIPSGLSKLLPSRFRTDIPDINIKAPSGTTIGRGVFPDADTTLIEISGRNARGENVQGFIRQTSGDTLQTPAFTSGVRNPQGQVGEFVVGRRRVVVTDVPETKITFEPNAALTQKTGVDVFTPEASTVINRNVQVFRQRNGFFGDGKLLRSFDTVETPAPAFTEQSLSQTNRLLNVVEDPQRGFSVAGSRREQAFSLTGSTDDLTITGVRTVREDAISQASFERTSATMFDDRNVVFDGPAIVRRTGEARSSRAPEFVFDDVPKLTDSLEVSRQSVAGGELKFVGEIKAPRIVTRGETSIGGGFDIISGKPPARATRPFFTPDPAPTPVPTVEVSTKGNLLTVLDQTQAKPAPKVQIKPTSQFSSAATPRTVRTDLLTTDLSEFGSVRPAAPILDQPSSFDFQTGSASLRNSQPARSFEPQIIELKPIVRPESASVGAQSITPVIDVNLGSAPRSRTRSPSSTRSNTSPIQESQPITAIDTIQTPVSIQTPQLGLGTGRATPDTPFRPRSGGFSLPGRVPTPLFLLPPSLPRLQNQFKPQGFRALVKIGGTFKAVGPVLSRSEALEFGARRVAQTPSASFKIQSAGRSVETTLGLKGFFRGFGRSKKDEDVFVEPNKLRINTPGELRGITFKGIQSSRFKKVF